METVRHSTMCFSYVFRVFFVCNANQTLMILDKPAFLEGCILSSLHYESELRNHTVVHSNASILPHNAVKPQSEHETGAGGGDSSTAERTSPGPDSR